MILPKSHLSESTSTPAPGLSSQLKSGGGKEPGAWAHFLLVSAFCKLGSACCGHINLRVINIAQEIP